jgi:hypothetical protein
MRIQPGSKISGMTAGLSLLIFMGMMGLAGLSPGRPQAAESFGRFGLGIKSGECAGGFGSQISYNFSSRLQASIGAGGISPFSFSFNSTRLRTDSYFALGKYYFNHLYLASGYSFKNTKVEVDEDGKAHKASAGVSGLPFLVGYEFGDREGMFFAASIGGIYYPVGGDEKVEVKTATESASTYTAASGLSIGLALGYYIP